MNKNTNAVGYTTRELVTIDEMKDTHELLGETDYGLDLPTYMKYLQDMVPKGYRQLVVMKGNTHVAVLGYWMRTKLYCGVHFELDNIIVARVHRSKGIGHLLFGYIERMAGGNDDCTVVFDAHVNNERAHRFYFREGYTIDGFHFQKQLR